MTKYNLALKQALIEECLSARSVHEVALKHDLSPSLLRRWVKGYEQHGAAGLLAKYSHYDAQFKLKVLQCIEQDGLSAQQACVQFDIRGPSSIRQWKRLYDKGGVEALHPRRTREFSMPRKPSKQSSTSPPTPADSELTPKQMLEELEYLRAENAYLKKLDALIQADPRTAQARKRRPVQGLRRGHRLALLLRAAGLARSTFYYQSKVLMADKHALHSSGPPLRSGSPHSGLAPGRTALNAPSWGAALDGHPCPSPPSARPPFGLLKSRSYGRRLG